MICLHGATDLIEMLRSSIGGAPPPPSAAQLPLRVHESGLHPGTERTVGPHCIAVEKLCECPLQPLVDIAELGFLGGDFGQSCTVERQTAGPLHVVDRRVAELVAGDDLGRRDLRGRHGGVAHGRKI